MSSTSRRSNAHSWPRTSAFQYPGNLLAGLIQGWPVSPASLFDYLVGAGEQRLRHREVEGPGGFEVDKQLEFRGLLDRQIGGLRAVEDLSGVNALKAVKSGKTGSIADQAAVAREIARDGDCRDTMA